MISSSLPLLLLSWSTFFSALFFFLAPLITFRGVLEKGTTGKLSILPYLMTFLQCSFWVLYGAMKEIWGSLVWTNVVGALLEFGYCLFFLRFSAQRKRDSLLFLFAGAGACALVGAVEQLISSPADTVGEVAVIMNIVMFGSPLSVSVEVVRSKSSEALPAPLCIMSFVAAACWTVYAIVLKDAKVLFPNICGVILGSIQIALIAIYPSRRSEVERMENRQSLLRADPVSPGSPETATTETRERAEV